MNNSNKEAKRLKKLAITYKMYAEKIGLTGNTIDDIHTLVKLACECQGEICKSADSIKEDDFTAVSEIIPIEKSTYMKFVKIAAMKIDGKLTDNRIEKLKESFASEMYNMNLKNAFLNSYVKDEKLKIVDSNNIDITNLESEENSKFEEILEHSAQTRIYIDSTLNKRYKIYAELAEYITEGKMARKEFKQITDFEYYKNGCYPTPTTPAKLWSVFNRFNESFRSMFKYKFDQISKLQKEFGLNITLGEANYVAHPWNNSSEDDNDNKEPID